MNKNEFEDEIRKIRNLKPEERYLKMVKLHEGVSKNYINAIKSISEDQSVKISMDGRTVAQVIGHIAEWERFIFQSLGEVISGVKTPRFYAFQGYVETDGSVHDFTSVDEFNAHQTEKYKSIPWTTVQEFAIYISQILYELFSKTDLINPILLENTTPLKNKEGIPVTTMGWQLWVIALEHGTFEHGSVLGI
ncbi:MAG: hypothetical protein ACXAD7_06935 [Candidatus Kariarchaeaceae archaeon]|jgi:hypothetical protein